MGLGSGFGCVRAAEGAVLLRHQLHLARGELGRRRVEPLRARLVRVRLRVRVRVRVKVRVKVRVRVGGRLGF